MSTPPPAPLDQVARPKIVPQLPAANVETTRRLLALGLVLFVSFAHFIASSAYHVMGLTSTSPDSRQYAARLISALIAEAGSLAVLWYVLLGQRRSWKNLGWDVKWLDAPGAVALAYGSTLAGRLVLALVQISYHSYSGHYLARNSAHGLLGLGISGLSIALVCLNPFFEELIVRGYLMSEILDLGGSGSLAIVSSVAVQMSYHLYQGLARGIVLTVGFTVFSIYYRKTRRIAPVVLAHFWIDAYALVRGSF